jgi:hypothetical protein
MKPRLGKINKYNSCRLDWDINTYQNPKLMEKQKKTTLADRNGTLTQAAIQQRTHASLPPNHHETGQYTAPPPPRRQSRQDEIAVVTACVIVSDDIPQRVARY